MKQPLTHSLPAKVMGVFLLIILAVLLLLSTAAALCCLHFGIYDRGISSYYDSNNCYTEIIDDLYDISYLMEEGVTDLTNHGYYDEYDICNLRFGAYNFRTGQYLANDSQMQFAMQQIVAHKVFTDIRIQEAYPSFYLIADVEPNADPQIARSSDGKLLLKTLQWDINDTYFIAGVVSPLSGRDAYFRQARLFELSYASRFVAPILMAFCAFALVGDLIFLCCAAGHRRGKEEITLNLQDRIPLDFYLITMGGLAVGLGFMIAGLFAPFDITCIMMALLLTIALLLVCLAVLLSLCTRIKKGKFWRNTLVFQFCRLFFLFCRTIRRWIRELWYSLKLSRRTLFWAVLISVGNHVLFSLGGGWYSGSALTLHLCLNAFLLAVIGSYATQMLRLKTAGEALANGNFEQEVDTNKLRGDLRIHGEHLNSLGEGLSIAVEQKMRSERLKTELITNVSHDIKTPLTSIINYVDLLQKHPTEQEQAEYLAVLDRQAKRLKKLTEDLVEASKASTGNISVNLSPTNLRELLDQSIGEYEDRLSAAGLETVVILPDERISVWADGRLLWRVLDNLLNNACKYAQDGTRVYLEAVEHHDQVSIIIKNISRKQLNLSPDELMERFVRGDSSRNTEGSGLGLNIAKSLIELQNGSFALSIDGDLFKAIITLPAVQPDPFTEVPHD